VGEGAGWVWEEKEGGRRSKMKTKKSTHPMSNRPARLHTLHPARHARRRRRARGERQVEPAEGLTGEMRTTDTGCKRAFDGSMAYCPQSAWIQNATLVSASVQLESWALSAD
jgi:hypothetical protein